MRPNTETAIRNWSASAEGWCLVERALEMAQLVIEHQPSTIVEIGVFAGGSLIPQALALKEIGTGRIYGIDPWSRQAAVEQVFTDGKTLAADEEIARKWWEEVDLERMHLLCMQGIWNHALEQHAVVIRARSEHCPELFNEIDVLYIDGSHSEEASCRDVELYLPKVACAGFVWIDDANWETVRKAVGLIEETCTLERDHEQYRLYRKR
jgi:predicted O-methyltransferase YrrM